MHLAGSAGRNESTRKRHEATRRRDGTAFEFSIGGQNGIMRLTPCKIGPLWAACRSVDDATQLPRKRALLHAITCATPSRGRVTVRVYTPSSSTDRSKCVQFFRRIRNEQIYLYRASHQTWFAVSVWPTIKGTCAHFLFAAISKNLFGRINAARSLTRLHFPALVEVSLETKN